jgi:hypothetical protein
VAVEAQASPTKDLNHCLNSRWQLALSSDLPCQRSRQLESQRLAAPPACSRAAAPEPEMLELQILRR